MTGNYPNLDLVKTKAYIKFGELLSIFLTIFSGSEYLTLIKGHNSVMNLRKLTGVIFNLDIVNINVYTSFDKILAWAIVLVN